MTFNEILRALRKENNVTQKQLGEAIGKSSRIISYYENEQSENNLPDSETLSKIAKFFGVSVDYLLGIADQRSTAKMELVQSLIDLTSCGKIAWDPITKDTAVPFENDNFAFMKYKEGFEYYATPETYTYVAYDGIDFKRSFSTVIQNNYYVLYHHTIDNEGTPQPGNKLYLSVFTGANEDDILTVSNTECGTLLEDLFEIINNTVNNNENKIIKSLLDDLNALSEPTDDIPF